MPDFSFYRFERSVVFLLVVFVFYAYSPAPVERPLVDANGVLASFAAPTSVAGIERPFLFGLATAAAHVEDELNDSWLTFAQAGKVAAFANTPRPELRNAFWTSPETEIDLAASTGVKLFRMGVDWGRIVPTLPTTEGGSVADAAALARYRQILQLVRAKGMSVMLTLFHHSYPSWGEAYGGLTHPVSVAHFVQFTELVVASLGDLVDYWVPFNEPTVFVGLTYCAGVWPPGFPDPGPLRSGWCMSAPFGLGNYSAAMSNVALAHRASARAIRAKYSAPIGAAHNIAYFSPAGVFDVLPSLLSDRLMTFPFQESIRGAIDFVGLNYYGQEFMAGIGKVAVIPEEEYSDSGRAIFPDGLYHLLKSFSKRFPTLPIILTENGVADSTDATRPAYIAEHVLAVAAARSEGVKVAGYVFWTVSDNWEWADGYCPKFGLAAVDRSTPALTRTLRHDSFTLFRDVASSGELTQAQADAAWSLYVSAAASKQNRSFCRTVEGGTGLTGAYGLDTPVPRRLTGKDWRLGRWAPPPYTDALSAELRKLRDAAVRLGAAAAGVEVSELERRWAAAAEAGVKAAKEAKARRGKGKAQSWRIVGDKAPDPAQWGQDPREEVEHEEL